ncbi:MAG: NUDIX domain-containing protein [Actinobacteria bacterium]|nr:NUDIX domain-containing protein [Actinomycetota bacterium]
MVGLISAGVLLWRRRDDHLEVLLGHPGGPLFARKDDWSVLKGEVEPGEDLAALVRREFEEESWYRIDEAAEMHELGEIRQKGGKLAVAWAVEGDLDPADAVSKTFEMEWPPRSGRTQVFPEVDRVEWFDLHDAREKIRAGQAPFLDRLERALSED